ncbi:hypothetical protein ZIOFF_066094 [Zingiber officinale]|uniref:Histidine-containing phosphotransfer protein n=1 Tax=Zingiber officinale TaxID=94328 RepID=A0A8J5EXU1_ZINOF|nr:hypothetical protein ZIOFF_066094 [Zingiber officinale]
MGNIDHALEKFPQDFDRLDSLIHQLKGSASSIGAAKMKNECTFFRDFCDKENQEGCIRSFQKVKKEHACLRQKLENYFQLSHDALALVASCSGKSVQLQKLLDLAIRKKGGSCIDTYAALRA